MERKEKILVVDDEEPLTDLLREWLEEGGYTVFTALDGQRALRIFFEKQPDLALIDILMPGKIDGFELCQRIREVSEIPIIILSALGHEQDKVRGLKLGADDYIVKPVGKAELLARVEAVLRRAKGAKTKTSIYDDGVLRLDFENYEAWVRGKPISLTLTEFKLLALLVQNSNRVLTHDELWDRVWGWDRGSLDSLKWYIASLRKKIEEDPANPGLIITVKGVGYRYRKPT